MSILLVFRCPAGLPGRAEVPLLRLGRAAERGLNDKTPGSRRLIPPAELLEILVARRQDDAGTTHLGPRSIVDEGRLVGLHRPVEFIEIRVLAERLGISAGRF